MHLNLDTNSAIGKASKAGVKLGKRIGKKIPRLAKALKKEAASSPPLHDDVRAALERMKVKAPGLEETMGKAHGYAVFPSVGKAQVVLGGCFGVGEVYQNGGVVGYAGLVQLTIGVQVGGQTFHELVVFDDANAFERFKKGKIAFAANASAVILKAGASTARNPAEGTTVYVFSEGGLGLEAAIGGQKFIYRPAALERGKSVAQAGAAAPA